MLFIFLFVYSILFENLGILLLSVLLFFITFYIGISKKLSYFYCDPIYIYPFFCFLYSFLYPFFSYVSGYISFLQNDYNYSVVFNGTLYNAFFYIIFSFLIYFFYKSKVEPNNLKCLIFDSFTRRKLNFLFELFFAVYVISLLNIFLSFNGVDGINTHLALNEAYSKIPFNSYLSYVFVSFSIFIIISFLSSNNLKNKLHHIPAICIVLIFFYIQLKSGNRRELTYLIFAIFLYFVSKNLGKISKKFYIFFALTFAMFILLGIYRTFSSTENVSIELLLYTIFGEFICPVSTLYFYISHYIDYVFGLTFINTIYIFIPRSLYPDKPLSLAEKFINDANLEFGYAFTPQSEFYLNYGCFGAMLGAIFLYITLKFICTNYKKYPFLFIAVYIEMMNIFRGEFTAYITEILIISISLKLFINFNNRCYG